MLWEPFYPASRLDQARGEGRSLAGEANPGAEGAGWGCAWKELRSDLKTRPQRGKQLRRSAGEPGRWRALCWEERAVGLTGNAPDQVPDQ